MVLSRNRREAGILSSFSSEYDECILVVDDSVTEIGEKAFVCCYNLKGLIVPDTVIRIGKDAFYGVPVSGIIYNGDAVDDYEDSNGRWGAE